MAERERERGGREGERQRGGGTERERGGWAGLVVQFSYRAKTKNKQINNNCSSVFLKSTFGIFQGRCGLKLQPQLHLPPDLLLVVLRRRQSSGGDERSTNSKCGSHIRGQRSKLEAA